MPFMQQIPVTSPKTQHSLSQLASRLSGCNTADEKIALFSKEEFLLPLWVDEMSWHPKELVVLYALHAIDQLETLQLQSASKKNLKTLMDHLLCVEDFYGFMGGIVGYQATCLSLSNLKEERQSRGIYHKPLAHDISKETQVNRTMRLSALRHLDELAEIYPIGGAADRLSRRSSQIAATRLFCEKSLLQRLIEDVKAKEALAERLFGLKVTIPIVLMTSDEKEGTRRVRKLLEEENWYGREPSAFFLVAQPLVPAMTPEGRWISTQPGCPLLKPGGHGVLWKVCRDQGALEWLKGLGKSKVLVRQINNPIAGVDDGLLTFIGCGIEKRGDFGFAACPRAPDVSEGVDVVIETQKGFTLTNIEYCDFEHFRVEPDADLLANTNLLYATIETIEEVLEKLPIPGLLINAKEVVIPSGDPDVHHEVVMRLESTMQNLADGLISPQLPTRSFITTNRRLKTISPIKRESPEGQILSQTPEQCLRDMQLNARELFESCHVTLEEDLLIEYHPCLGPFYDVIRKKICGGTIKKGSHIDLSISEVEINELELDGALTVQALCMEPGAREGRCVLDRVTVCNRGLDQSQIPSLASSPRAELERCHIMISEGGEFYASNVQLNGGIRIVVPEKTRIEAVMDGGELKLIETAIEAPTWQWEYGIGNQNQITVKKLS